MLNVSLENNKNLYEDFKSALEYLSRIDYNNFEYLAGETIFHYLKPGGIYIVEDIVTLWNLSHGSEWGQMDRTNFTDCTQKVFENFLEKGIIKSPYLLNDECKYLEKNIKEIKIYYPKQQQRSDGPLGPSDLCSPITGRSALAVIIKK